MVNPFKPRLGRSGAGKEPSVLQTRWFASLLSFCILLVIVAGIVEFYWRADIYASQTIKRQFDQAGGTGRTGAAAVNPGVTSRFTN